MSDSFFTVEGDWFRPTGACRGPWDPDACHAGPPTGLLARASERLVPEQRLVRLTVDLTRPIPHAGFRIVSSVTRAGRTVSTTEMAIVDADDRSIVTARGMHLAAQTLDDVPNADVATPRLDEAVPGDFPRMRNGTTSHGLEMFSSGVEVMYPPGDGPEPGPGRMWMRARPLLPDEVPSPFQRICPLADCGNAVSRNENPGRLAFMNTDLTIALHRAPVGEWFGSDAVSHWQPDGIGLADALLYDELGPVGRAVQTLVIQAMQPRS